MKNELLLSFKKKTRKFFDGTTNWNVKSTIKSLIVQKYQIIKNWSKFKLNLKLWRDKKAVLIRHEKLTFTFSQYSQYSQWAKICIKLSFEH